jgi:hypothetical protein
MSQLFGIRESAVPKESEVVLNTVLSANAPARDQTANTDLRHKCFNSEKLVCDKYFI